MASEDGFLSKFHQHGKKYVLPMHVMDVMTIRPVEHTFREGVVPPKVCADGDEWFFCWLGFFQHEQTGTDGSYSINISTIPVLFRALRFDFKTGAIEKFSPMVLRWAVKMHSVLTPSAPTNIERHVKSLKTTPEQHYLYRSRNQMTSQAIPCQCKHHISIDDSTDTPIHPSSEYVLGKPACRVCFNRIFYEPTGGGWLTLQTAKMHVSEYFVTTMLQRWMSAPVMYVLIGLVVLATFSERPIATERRTIAEYEHIGRVFVVSPIEYALFHYGPVRHRDWFNVLSEMLGPVFWRVCRLYTASRACFPDFMAVMSCPDSFRYFGWCFNFGKHRLRKTPGFLDGINGAVPFSKPAVSSAAPVQVITVRTDVFVFIRKSVYDVWWNIFNGTTIVEIVCCAPGYVPPKSYRSVDTAVTLEGSVSVGDFVSFHNADQMSWEWLSRVFRKSKVKKICLFGSFRRGLSSKHGMFVALTRVLAALDSGPTHNARIRPLGAELVPFTLSKENIDTEIKLIDFDTDLFHIDGLPFELGPAWRARRPTCTVALFQQLFRTACPRSTMFRKLADLKIPSTISDTFRPGPWRERWAKKPRIDPTA